MPDTLQSLIADPPRVHGYATTGLWSTVPECYEFLWDNVLEGQRTLETGCGLSTAVFAIRKTMHIAVFNDPREGEEFELWAGDRGVDIGRVDLHCGGSDVVLPNLSLPELDLVFIDGGHGYPLPILDWYYSCAYLRQGGLLVVDDAHIAGVQRLIEYLDHDPRWIAVQREGSWRAYRRTSAGPLGEGWQQQPFLPGIHAGDAARIWRARQYLHPWRQRLGALGRVARR